MKNIILQHWSGPINELTELSVASISAYADQIGVEHRLLIGDLFMPGLTAPCQKMHMLSEEFDEYDIVVMTDADMFARKGIQDNIFTDTTGCGWHGPIQDRLVASLEKRFPKLCNKKYPYWGGSTYRLPRELRQLFRSNIRENEMRVFSGNMEDEGMMHRLAVRSDFKVDEHTYYPSYHWNASSYMSEQIVDANFIHIRTKATPTGPKRTKMENYLELHNAGII